MKFKGLIPMGLGAMFFYLMFFKFAPWVATLLPQNEWAGILTIVVYGIIAWLGGGTVTLMLVIWGLKILLD